MDIELISRTWKYLAPLISLSNQLREYMNLSVFSAVDTKNKHFFFLVD